MSADGWTMCPKCNTPNPDSIQDPESEYYGLLRIDFEHDFNRCGFSLRFYCCNDKCDFSHEFTENDFFPLGQNKQGAP